MIRKFFSKLIYSILSNYNSVIKKLAEIEESIINLISLKLGN